MVESRLHLRHRADVYSIINKLYTQAPRTSHLTMPVNKTTPTVHQSTNHVPSMSTLLMLYAFVFGMHSSIDQLSFSLLSIFLSLSSHTFLFAFLVSSILCILSFSEGGSLAPVNHSEGGWGHAADLSLGWLSRPVNLQFVPF